MAETAGRLPLGSTVLPPHLLPVFPKVLVELGMSDDVVLGRRFGVRGQQILVEEDANLAVFDLEQDHLSHGPVGHDVAVGVERDLAVPVDLAKGLERGVVVEHRKRPQMGPLVGPTFLDRLMMGAVDSAVGRLIQPDQDIPVGLRERAERVAPPEALPQEVDRPFHFAFHPGAVGSAGLGLEAVMMGEVQALGVEDRLPGRVPIHHDVLHVVVKDLGRHAAQVLEAPDVAVQERLQRAAVHELDIVGPAEAQDQHEDEDRGSSPAGLLDLEVPPVELGLLPWLGLEPDVGQSALLGLDRPDEALHRVIAAAIAPVLELIEDPGGLVVVHFQKVPDGLFVGRQDGVLPLVLPILGEVGAFQMLLDRRAVKAELPGDRPDALAAPLHGSDVHVYLLGDHRVSPPLPEETIPPQSPGGTLFNPIIGTVLHAQRQHCFNVGFGQEIRFFLCCAILQSSSRLDILNYLRRGRIDLWKDRLLWP